MELKQLMINYPQSGKVEWLSFRPLHRETVSVVEKISISPEIGIVGDHYKGLNKKRQVTIIQSEHIKTAANFLSKQEIDPKLLRRNIVVSGINILTFKDQQFRIGEVVLEFTGLCHPCSRMEENLGKGGYNAMRGHGGITAKVLKGGEINLGDEVSIIY